MFWVGVNQAQLKLLKICLLFQITFQMLPISPHSFKHNNITSNNQIITIMMSKTYFVPDLPQTQSDHKCQSFTWNLTSLAWMHLKMVAHFHQDSINSKKHANLKQILIILLWSVQTSAETTSKLTNQWIIPCSVMLELKDKIIEMFNRIVWASHTNWLKLVKLSPKSYLKIQ